MEKKMFIKSLTNFTLTMFFVISFVTINGCVKQENSTENSTENILKYASGIPVVCDPVTESAYSIQGTDHFRDKKYDFMCLKHNKQVAPNSPNIINNTK